MVLSTFYQVDFTIWITFKHIYFQVSNFSMSRLRIVNQMLGHLQGQIERANLVITLIQRQGDS